MRRVSASIVIAIVVLALLENSGNAASSSPRGAPPSGTLPKDIPAAARKVDDWEILRVSELRAALGLRSDLQFVADLIARPERYGASQSTEPATYAGLAVTADEAVQMVFRNAIQGYAMRTAETLRREQPQNYMGYWLDSSAGIDSTVVYFAIAENNEVVDRAVHAEAEFRSIGRIDVKRYGSLYLEELAGRIRDRLSRTAPLWAPFGSVQSIGFSIQTDEIIMAVESDTVEAAVIAREFLNEPIRIVKPIDAVPTGNPTCSGSGALKCDWNWVYGGLQLRMEPGGLACTSNIAVTFGGIPGVLTAGHCLPDSRNAAGWADARVYQGANYFGGQNIPPPNGDVIGWPVAREEHIQNPAWNTHNTGLIWDAGLYANGVGGTRPGIGRMHNSIYSPATVLAGVGDPGTGLTVCTTGFRSTGDDGARYINDGVRCGYILSQPTGITYVTQNGVTWPFQFRTTAGTAGGDSGAVHYASLSGSLRAVGIQSGWIGTSTNACWNGSSWINAVTGSVGPQQGYPCRNSLISPLVSTMAAWGLNFQAG